MALYSDLPLSISETTNPVLSNHMLHETMGGDDRRFTLGGPDHFSYLKHIIDVGCHRRQWLSCIFLSCGFSHFAIDSREPHSFVRFLGMPSNMSITTRERDQDGFELDSVRKDTLGHSTEALEPVPNESLSTPIPADPEYPTKWKFWPIFLGLFLAFMLYGLVRSSTSDEPGSFGSPWPTVFN